LARTCFAADVLMVTMRAGDVTGTPEGVTGCRVWGFLAKASPPAWTEVVGG
jgi:hypothetical protein